MIAVIFEVRPASGHEAEYFDRAASLRPSLAGIDGFISVERFRSLTDPGKVLSLSFWRDEDAVRAWRTHAGTPGCASGGPWRRLRGLPPAHRRGDPRLRPRASRRGARGQPPRPWGVTAKARMLQAGRIRRARK